MGDQCICIMTSSFDVALGGSGVYCAHETFTKTIIVLLLAAGMRTEDDEDQLSVVIFVSCLRLLFECVAIPARVNRLSVFCWFEAASHESTTFLHDMIRSLPKNKRFHVELSGKRTRWRKQKNGLPR